MEFSRLKKQFFFILLAGIGLATIYASTSWAGQAVLSWNRNTESDLAGYKVYFSTTSGSYPNVLDVGKTATPNSPQFTVNNLTEGVTYYFTVKSYDYSMNLSGFSKEVWKTIVVSDPPPPPPDPVPPSSDPLPEDPTSENRPPVANAGADQSVLDGTEVHLNGGGSSDPDGDSLTYFWIQTSGQIFVSFILIVHT